MRLLRRFFPAALHSLTSVDAYARWAHSYPAEAHNPLMQLEQDAMLSLVPDMRDKLVLDLACGTGRYGKMAVEAGAKQVFGFDNSEAMLRVATIKQIALATSAAIPLATQSVDLVLCGLALGHLPKIESSISEISRVLKNGGKVLISDFHPYQAIHGAKRTFSDRNGKTYAVEHYVHHLSEYFGLGMASGLRLNAVLEPQWQGVPVVLVLSLEKF